jgi:hypothetical protein
MQLDVDNAPQSELFKVGDSVFIRPEVVDHVNPVIGEGDIVNYQPWEITDIYNERLWGGSIVSSCNLKQGKLILKSVWLAYLIPTVERRHSRLEVVLDDKD